MKTEDPIRVLLLANEFNAAQISLHKHRDSSDLEITEGRSGGHALRQMRDAPPDVLVVESNGFDELTLAELLLRAAECSPEIPVIVLGSDDKSVHDAIRFLEEGAADYLPLSHSAQLASVIRRVQRESDMLSRHAELEFELRAAYNALLGNQKLMAVGRLAASIAHEINNPLESITNLLFLLRSEPDLSERVKSYLALAEGETGRVAQITKQTLNFYREASTPVQVKPADLLDEILVLYGRKIEERRLEVVRQYNSDVTLLVFPGEIRQILSNLVTNAVEASPIGGKLTLRVHRGRNWSDDRVSGIRIVVGDNGSGVSAETRRHIGQLFYTTKGQRGTGLGLWVTRAIIARYGGEMQLYSSTREGRRGTVFSIFMPTNLYPQPIAMDESSPGSGGRDKRRGDLTIEHSGTQFGKQAARTRNFRKRPSALVAS